MILLLDNYDSFTFNLYQYLGQLGAELKVIRNDELTPQEAAKLNPTHLVLSPGPGRPENAGYLLDYIREFNGKIPILGICLGHQAIGHVFGGAVTYAPELFHGKTSVIEHDKKGVYHHLDQELQVARYHSLVVEEKTLPQELIPTAHSQDGVLMGLRHATTPTEGIQFHPESILTPQGLEMLKNFIFQSS